MKKIFTICFALLSAMTAFAQDFEAKGSVVFVNSNGTEIPDGSEITIRELEIDEDEFFFPMVKTGLYAKRTVEDGRLGGKLVVNISKMDNGALQFCWGASCQSKESTGRGETAIGTLNADYLNNDLQTEWVPAHSSYTEAEYGQCDVTLSLYAAYNQNEDASGYPEWDNLGVSSTITCHLINPDPTGINDIASDANASVVARYSVDGKLVNGEQKGINIVKLSNGKTVKVVR